MLIATWILLGLWSVTMVFAVVRVGAEPRNRTVTEPGKGVSAAIPSAVVGGPRAAALGASTVRASGSVTGLYRNHSAAYWAWRFRQRTQQLQAARGRSHALTRMLLHRPSVTEAINLASVVYGNGSTLWRKARCESHLNPSAVNGGSGSSGLFQFIPSTFASTPYGGFSIWSPYASAMAAGWMHAHGRGGEWQCR